MTNKLNMSLQKGRKRVRMRSRISRLVLLAAVLQMLTSVAILIFGGEFRYIKEFSYNTLVEKTESRSAYIQSEFQEKSAIVREYAEQLSRTVNGILEERGASITDLRTDKELSYSIIESSVDIVSSLLRCSMANDAYLILETGDLHSDESGDTAKAALYLQTVDSDPQNADLLMVLGYSSVAENFGISCVPDGPQYFSPDPQDMKNFGFYYMTLQTAREHRGIKQDKLGYWSGFSKLSSVGAASMKYTMPLITDDGTVYGVLGIGLAEDTILSSFPSKDLQSETESYAVGHSDYAGKSFYIVTHIGSAYDLLMGKADTLRVGSRSEYNGDIYNFEAVGDLSGSVQYLEMYDSNSPYAEEKWALISVADTSDILQPLLMLQRMFAVSALLSLIVAAFAAVLGSGAIIKPLSNLSKLMKTKRKYNEVIRFQPSNVYEVDEITDSITQLQINVQGFSSQVSKMISVADVGLGTFMYDRTDDSVFVGQSLIKVLKLDLPQGEDIMMSRQEFLNSIKNPEMRTPIAVGLGMQGGDIRGDLSKVYQINQPNGGTLWMRLGYTYSPNTAIGIVQDITRAMIEKNRIEYERDYDNLTGLLNRHAYYRSIEKLFHDESKLNITAFVMIDLDNLKYINDTYGHNFGDDYLKTAANALKKFQDHGGIVSRLSGDEFNICLPGFSSKEEVREIIASVRSELLQSSCLLADGTHFGVSGSMGVSWYPSDAESRELLMKYADFAMYTVKHSTKGGIAEFDRNSYSADSVLLTGVKELKRIIEESSVKYAFQSIVSVKTCKIYGYEALMRVQSEIFRSPLELLRTAKTGAKLYEIERLTWTRALADFQALIDSGRIEKTAHLFVNSIANNKLDPEVEAELEVKYSHLLDKVVIEILESENSDEECTSHKAQIMRKCGGMLALDDFGTGYNNEYALLSLRPNIIKIDISIISGCDKDADRRMIIENLVKLARARNVLVLAEGVETEEEMKTVISCGVDLLQGYYLARPVYEPEPISQELADKIRRLANHCDASEDSEL